MRQGQQIQSITRQTLLVGTGTCLENHWRTNEWRAFTHPAQYDHELLMFLLKHISICSLHHYVRGLKQQKGHSWIKNSFLNVTKMLFHYQWEWIGPKLRPIQQQHRSVPWQSMGLSLYRLLLQNGSQYICTYNHKNTTNTQNWRTFKSC